MKKEFKKEFKNLLKIKKELNEMNELDLEKLFLEVSDGLHEDTYSVDEINVTGNIWDITVSNNEPKTHLRIICGRDANSQDVHIGVTTPNNFTFECYLNQDEATKFIKMQELICRYILNAPHNTDPFIITIYP